MLGAGAELPSYPARELLLLALEHPAHTAPMTFCPPGALQDLLSTERVPVALYGLAAGQPRWKSPALPHAGGAHPRPFLLRARFKGVQLTMTLKNLGFS